LNASTPRFVLANTAWSEVSEIPTLVSYKHSWSGRVHILVRYMAGALAFIMLCLFLHYGRIWGYHTHEDSHSTLDRHIPTTKLLDTHSSLRLVTQMRRQTDNFCFDIYYSYPTIAFNHHRPSVPLLRSLEELGDYIHATSAPPLSIGEPVGIPCL
jgi:hypothetical protein